MCAAQDSFHVVCAQLPQRFDMSRPTGRPAERLADGTQLLNAGQVLVLQMELTYRSQTRSDAATLPTALACDDVIPAFALYPDYADVDTTADIDLSNAGILPIWMWPPSEVPQYFEYIRTVEVEAIRRGCWAAYITYCDSLHRIQHLQTWQAAALRAGYARQRVMRYKLRNRALPPLQIGRIAST